MTTKASIVGIIRRALVIALAVACRVGLDGSASAAETCRCTATTWGLSGGVLVDSTDVLPAGVVRFGVSALTTRGGSGNRLDGLDEPGDDQITATVTRGNVAVGLRGDTELAITAPYVHLTPEGASGTGGRGDIALSFKQRMWEGASQWPSAAFSASYVGATAARDRPVRTVTHDAYRTSLVLQSERPVHARFVDTVAVTADVGGLFKDPLRVEHDEILLFGLGVSLRLPERMGGLFDRDTGLFGRDATGRYVFAVEAVGTRFRGDRAPTYDDSISVIAALRYTASHWGLMVSGHSTTYSRDTKQHATGGSILGSVAF
jgi:hypothetical protein